MREQWNKVASRFNALGQRERILGFLASLVGLVLLFYLLALEPQLVAKKRLTQQIAETRQGLTLLQQQLKAQQGRGDPDAARKSERDALRKQLADLDRTMAQVQRGLVPPERTATLLEEVLARSRGLQLVSLRTLPVQRFDPRGPGAESKELHPERQLYQHGFEITLQGSYAELHEYLNRVEQLPWQMFWNRISMNSEDPSQLTFTLTVQTLSLSKAWLIV
jgi:MSHA biogenesis protein MshJ